MSELSRDEVIAITGPLSDIVVAEIIGTGISKTELVSAFARVVTDRKTRDHGPTLKPGAFARVVELLERLHLEGGLGEAGSRLE
jgi:hypothetical protein